MKEEMERPPAVGTAARANDDQGRRDSNTPQQQPGDTIPPIVAKSTIEPPRILSDYELRMMCAGFTIIAKCPCGRNHLMRVERQRSNGFQPHTVEERIIFGCRFHSHLDIRRMLGIRGSDVRATITQPPLSSGELQLRHEVYSHLLGILAPMDTALDALALSGISEETAQRNQYAVVHDRDFAELAAAAMTSRFGNELAWVPGFFRDPAVPGWSIVTNKAGQLLVPVRSPDGRILMLTVYLADYSGEYRRRFPFSSGGGKGGALARFDEHVTLPPPGCDSGRVVAIASDPLTADVIAEGIGVRVMATSYPREGQQLEALRALLPNAEYFRATFRGGPRAAASMFDQAVIQ